MKKLLAAVLVGIATFAASVIAQNAPFRIASEMQRGAPSYIRFAPSYIDARVLAANVSETHTVPGGGANTVLFSANCAEFYVKTGASAAVPAADVTDGTASERNPAAWVLSSTTTQITLISPTACTITLTWYLIS